MTQIKKFEKNKLFICISFSNLSSSRKILRCVVFLFIAELQVGEEDMASKSALHLVYMNDFKKTENLGPAKNSKTAQTFSRQFLIRHVFRAGAIIWVKHKSQDFYVVFKSHTRPNRGIQLPGGRVEKNENPAECIVREVFEETGIQTKIVCPLGFLHFENKEDNYSNMQTYFIVKPIEQIDPVKIWEHIDLDYSKQKLELWCVPVSRNPAFLSVGQDRIVHMFRKWLFDHKRI